MRLIVKATPRRAGGADAPPSCQPGSGRQAGFVRCCLKGYGREIILVGITDDKESKKHICKIETMPIE